MSQTDMLIWVQSFARPWLDQVMIAFSFIGNEEFYLATVPLIYFAINKRVGIRLAIVLAMSMFVNGALKFAFGTPRPIGTEGIRSLYLDSAPGMSFPSGHAQGSATYWGYLATQIRRPWFTWLAGLIIFMVMLSRLYLGVHWPIDVVGGLLLGLVFVFAIGQVDTFMSRRPVSFGAKLAVGIVMSVLLLVLYHEEDGRKLGGFLLGTWMGYLFETKYVGMELSPEWGRRIAGALLAVAMVFAMRVGLKAILPVGAMWDLIRYIIIGLWATWGTPALFVRLGLYRWKGRFV